MTGVEFNKALTTLFASQWSSERLKGNASQLGKTVTEDENGLLIEVVGRERTGSVGDYVRLTYTVKYSLRVPMEKWQALIRYVCREQKWSETRAVALLRYCAEESLKEHRSGESVIAIMFAGAGLAGLMLVMLLYGMLNRRLRANDLVASIMKETVETIPVTACIAGGLLFLLLMLIATARIRYRSRQRAKFWGNGNADLDSLLPVIVPEMMRPLAAVVNKPLAAALALGCAGCVYLSMLPPDVLMLPSQKLDYYYENEIKDHMDKAEAALGSMSSRKAEEKLTERLEQEYGMDEFLTGVLAARLKKSGHFSAEAAEKITQPALKNVDIREFSANNEKRLQYLAELIDACSAGTQIAWLKTFRVNRSVDAKVLEAIGRGMSAQPLEHQMDAYDVLTGLNYDGDSFLRGAIGSASSVEEIRALLLAAPEEYRAVLSGIWARELGSGVDETLAYLRMVVSMGITLDAGSAQNVPVEYDLSTLLIAAEPTNVMPEGAHTILPLIRSEKPARLYGESVTYSPVSDSYEPKGSFIDRDEGDVEYQDIRICAQVLSALTEDRIPGTAAEADLILLFDQQYQQNGYDVVNVWWLPGSSEKEAVPLYDLLHRVSLYDARTGACVMTFGENRKAATPLSDMQKVRQYQNTGVNEPFKELMDTCYPATNTQWMNTMYQSMSNILREHGGDLSFRLESK